MIHKCHICSKIFNQKGHLENHLKRKKTCQKCNKNFKTQYAYINNNCIHINDFIKKKKNLDKIKCLYGHELILCKGEIRKPYFKHKNISDTCGFPITEWHSRMQSYFPVTEKIFNKVNHQIKERRADVYIEKFKFIIEIQHSNIDESNVICRTKDYLLHNINIIWLIDGNTNDIILEKFSNDNYLITFLNDWKYKSFQYNNDFILLDIQDKIFKIPVKKVCNKMILVKEYKNIDYVMNYLNNFNPDTIWNEWEDDNEIKASLKIQQKGAGNGKTYGIWQNICLNKDKELFIIVTKQHSAKSVIFKELIDQSNRNEYHIVDNIVEYNNLNESTNTVNNKFVIKYKHKYSNHECLVIIGTIDSLIYNICHKENDNNNFFEGLLNTIQEYGVTKVNKTNGSINYAGKQIKLNKKTELWIDEAQDLSILYFNAIIKLMLQTKIDVVVVGDKLQSLEHEVNFMTYQKEIPNIHIIRDKPINENRRIKIKNMSDKINKLINFSLYNLPNIKIPFNNKLNESTSLSPIETIHEPVIYASVNTDENRNNINNYINLILEKVNFEVKTNKYKPNDFLFIFPIMKGNLLAYELETKLNEYWINEENDKENYNQYAIIHKHEDGQVIDTSSSINSSRLVSIKTSKGDGRSVVFVLGCNENTLKIVSKSDNVNIIFESYLHVALTRAKNKIYFGVQKNNDIIHQKFGGEGLIEYKPVINISFDYDKIYQNINKTKIINLLKQNGVKELLEENTNLNKKQDIDWTYHCIRRSIYLQYSIFIIFKENKNNNNFNNSQLKVVLDKISNLPIKSYYPKEFFNYINNVEDFSKGKDMPFYPSCLPLCNLSHKKQYKKIFNKFIKCIRNNNLNYKKNNLSIENQTPIEAIIQWYCIELFTRKKYIETTPSTIYNLINHFNDNYESKITEIMKESLIIKEVTLNAMNNICKNDTNIKWNIEHMIKYNGNCDDFKLFYKNIPIIGWSDSFIYHIVFQTNFNKLNFWDTIIKITIERFIIYNVGDKGDDLQKIKNKPINTYLFILKKNNYEIINWDWDQKKEFDYELKKICKNAIVKYFSSYNETLYKYCKYIKTSNKWREKYKSPYEYLANIYSSENSNTRYIRDFFKFLSTLSKNEAKEITNNYDIFSSKINIQIENACDIFFGINEKSNYDENDDDEW